MNLLVNSATGVFNWQWFAVKYAPNYTGIAPKDLIPLRNGPGDEDYIEASINVERDARRGKLHICCEEGDIWEGEAEELAAAFSEDYDSPPL